MQDIYIYIYIAYISGGRKQWTFNTGKYKYIKSHHQGHSCTHERDSSQFGVSFVVIQSGIVRRGV